MSASTSVFPANALTIPRALSGSLDPVATYWPMLPSQVSHSSPTWALRKALLRVSLSAQRRRTSWRMISGKHKASCSSYARTTSNIGRSLLARQEQVVRWTQYSALPRQASLRPTGRTCMCLVFLVITSTIGLLIRRRYTNYTTVWNALDYASTVFPVTKVDAVSDIKAQAHVFRNSIDKTYYEMCRQHTHIVIDYTLTLRSV